MVLRVHRSAGWQAHFSTSISSAGRNSNFNTKNQTSMSRLLPWECPRGGGRSHSRSQHGHLASRSHPAPLGGSKSPRDSGCLERQVLKPVETGRGAPSHPALCSGSRGGVGGRHPAPSRPGGGACGCRGGREAGRPAQTIAGARPPGLHVFPTFVLRELAVLLALTLSVVAMKVGPPLASPPCLGFPLSHHVPRFLPVCAPRPAQPGSWGVLDRDGPSAQFVLKTGVSEAGTGETALWILQ